ncbi:hypothetical protein [Methylobacterium sp. NEAU K]|uniref:hypothetical protein n=1 Tax=Methylobacterium sp. NEAU K TaxID=3064946 RepID=UPI002736340C|nr:hypothetical protein [Methylobacterium sp. NEAU K]MDP4006687.1 hypothetical protein [Methylobacterium sp. NEAU K]
MTITDVQINVVLFGTRPNAKIAAFSLEIERFVVIEVEKAAIAESTHGRGEDNRKRWLAISPRRDELSELSSTLDI